MKWLFNRLKEPSTWSSISAATGALAVSLQSGEGLIAALVTAAIGFAMSEGKNNGR